ncbi:hypothetical protein R6Q57_023808 [Mikania cordata]
MNKQPYAYLLYPSLSFSLFRRCLPTVFSLRPPPELDLRRQNPFLRSPRMFEDGVNGELESNCK